RLGGWAGHAGLFGTADDLARYAQSLLGGQGVKPVLRPSTVRELMQPHSPLDQAPWRGLGWQLEAPLTPDRDALPGVGLIGHTGYTGTGLWIDLVQKRFVVILSHRVHPDGRGNAQPLRRQVLALLSSIAPPLSRARLDAVDPRWASLQRPPVRPEDAPLVSTGIDVLRDQNYAALQGQRVGLITNLTAVDGRGWRTLDRLRHAPGVHLIKVFSPEHGLFRELEGRIPSGTEPLSGLPLLSLYGQVRQPTPEMLRGLDVLVFDIQDAGARYFTYISTLGLAMEAAAKAGLSFVVLDRPNPVGADQVKGPVLDADRLSFTGYTRLPVQHGMTVGELAGLFKDELRTRQPLDVQLTVVPMRGYQRAMRFDQTRLDWIPPSPNLRTLSAALLYPGTAWVEGSNVSVGRGTPRPFAWIGAPWIDGTRLAEALNRRALPGVSISPVSFTPDAATYQGQLCQGVEIRITQRDVLDAPALGLALVQALQQLWPETFKLERTRDMIGSAQTLQAIKDGRPAAEIEAGWQEALKGFEERRRGYLVYGR
ncbi:MAG TPA: exo-beta-N-acetylmuramidase NamZ domain-containing protein, partial [Aquabacterium sp.]|nr:exo-beta-N-acetylmuramidase NamZ domain-containing protein [Aquabacterium sp.]